MAWRPKTVIGKILKGAVIGVGVVGAAALAIGTAGATIPAIGGVITAAGGVAGKVLQKSMKTVDAVGSAATDLVSGITKEQRQLVAAQKDETKAEMEKLTAIQKLINAGSTVEKAAASVGVSLSSLAGSFGIPSAGDVAATQLVASQQQVQQSSMIGTGGDVMAWLKANPVIAAVGGIALIFILPKLLKLKR